MNDNPFHGMRGLMVERLPALQLPGGDELLAKAKMEMPGRDRRLYLSLEQVEVLHRLATSSISRRVVLHGLELTCELYRGKDGSGNAHLYEVIKLGGVPRAEGSLLDELTINTRGSLG